MTVPFAPRLLLSLVLAAPVAAFAAPPQLPDWEHLTEQQREQLIAPLRARWDAEPADRARLLERAARWEQLSPGERRRAHHGIHRWEKMSPAQRAQTRALYARMRDLDHDDRRELKRQWRAMTPEQREAWAEANPAPARDD